MWGGLGPWLRFWQRVRDGLCAGGAGCAQRLVRRGRGAQQLVPGTGRVRNGCAQRLVCRGGGAQRLCLGGVHNGLKACGGGGGGALSAQSGVCATGVCAGGGVVRHGLCAVGVCATRCARAGAAVAGRWHVHKGLCGGVVRNGLLPVGVVRNGLCAQRVVRGGRCAQQVVRGGSCAQRVVRRGARPVPGRWHVHKGLCGGCARNGLCPGGGRGVRNGLCAGGGGGVCNGLCARGGAQQLVPGKGRVPQKKSHMSSSFRSPAPRQVCLKRRGPPLLPHIVLRNSRHQLTS